MASAAHRDGASTASDPTVGARRIRRNASLAAAGQMEGLRCLDMMAEYRQCISANHQFHQYYIHGEFSHCKMQKTRMYNCVKWKTSNNQKAREELLKSFEEEQLSMHTETPVWEMREHPPQEWTSSDSRAHNEELENSANER